MLRRLYDWTMDLSAKPYAMWALAAVAFMESSFFPLPPDLLIISMVLASRSRAWKIAAVSTLGSVVGGLFGYAIGHYMFAAVGRPLLDFYGYTAKFEVFQSYYNQWGAWIVAGAGFTPIPYKVFTIASGVSGLNLGVFTIASTLSRGGRFFLEAGLLWYYGEPIRHFIEAHLGKLALFGFALLFGGFILIKYVF